MRRKLSYRDAVVLLGGESALTGVLDKASSVALFGLGAIDLFDARGEAVKLGDGLIRALRDKVKGLSRYDRTERLVAAHAVVVINAYFEALAGLDVVPKLSRADQDRLVRPEGAASQVDWLLAAELPVPAPQLPREELLVSLSARYQGFSYHLETLVRGLSCWDEWDDRRRQQVRDTLHTVLPARACRRYEELFRQLVADFPEVACWSDLIEHQATRAEIRRGMADLLAELGSGRRPSDRLRALVLANQAALDRPIVSAADVPAGMTIPLLRDGYVTPSFRVLPGDRDRRPADERSWEVLPRRDDLTGFLSGHLTLPQAVDAPLLVLGQPGAGKSVLTRMLAARLPAGEFLPVRVELRGVPADSDVLAQIEHAIRDALDETMSWPDLVHAAGGALPVVMLDGFDELLQATGVSQVDYLERVAQFQRRQADRGRALAVIVTSRSAVADRARVPRESPVLRLEPFDEGQVRQWTATWNEGNRAYFAGRGLLPLAVEDVLAVPELAGQPLLLLMLALYDADSNALRLGRGRLDETGLYERLLAGFAGREVRKAGEPLSDADLSRAVEDELLLLSATAFAMINRGRQWVAEDDLEADLRALFGPRSQTGEPYGFRRRLTRAEEVIGGFFFVHRTQALRDQQRLRTYEFLHATFGEYLVARLLARELVDLAQELAFAASRNRPTAPDDSFLHALLSFAVLTVRGPVMRFLRSLVGRRVPGDGRALLNRRLRELFAASQRPRPGSPYDGYEPVPQGVPARYAAYSGNLLLLCLLTADGPLPGTDLFTPADAGAANENWRRIARLWHSQLGRAGWESLTATVRVRHFLEDGVRRMEVSLDRGEDFNVAGLAFLTWPESQAEAADYDVAVPADSPLGPLLREISFRDDSSLGRLFVGLLPYATELGADPGYYGEVGALLTLLFSPVRDPEQRLRLYERALAMSPSEGYLDVVYTQLAADRHKLPADRLLKMLEGQSFRVDRAGWPAELAGEAGEQGGG
ncbi:hypothetical protein ABZ297_39250 [Nonomuraea sp. NPDC005983]|uniref:NACHT domain-containing protein n=1 Tax=Nonomuraea sp. NPDC005983 TaxID=3155595 RepID=UPI0033BF519E